VDNQRTRQRQRQRLRYLAQELAIPAAGIAVFALGQLYGDDTTGTHLLEGFFASAVTVDLVYPGAFFGWSAPRWWFAGPRPGPSATYLRWSRIGAAVLLALLVLAALLGTPSGDEVTQLPPGTTW
jgi:hypothetical protein